MTEDVAPDSFEEDFDDCAACTADESAETPAQAVLVTLFTALSEENSARAIESQRRTLCAEHRRQLEEMLMVDKAVGDA